MLYNQLFVDAIANALHDCKYTLVNNSFYIFNREIGLVISFGFDMFMNGSNFAIYGGADALCSQIDLWPNGQLSICGYDVNAYAPICGETAIDNLNINTATGDPKRYSKSLLTHKLDQNISLLEKCLLPDLLQIRNLEDYYNFKVKADGTRYFVATPFPTINTFFLCISLGKFKEASHIYHRMLLRQDNSIYDINACMHLASQSMINDALTGIDAQATSIIESFARIEREADVIEQILRDHHAALTIATQSRIDSSRATCDRFFAK